MHGEAFVYMTKSDEIES